MKSIYMEQKNSRPKLIIVSIIGLLMILLLVVDIPFPALGGEQLVKANSYKYATRGYITWGNLSNVWNNGATLASDPSLDYLTHIVGPAVVPASVSNPTVEGMYGDISVFTYVVDAGHSRGIKVSPYLYASMSMISSIVSEGTLPTLINSISDLITRYNLDGIELDIEQGTNQSIMDSLINALYSVLNPMGKSITIAAIYGAHCNGNIVPDVSLATAQKLDFIDVMCYDMNDRPDKNPSDFPHATYADAINAMQKWIDVGYPKNKLVMGIPFYGKDEEGSVYLYRDIVDRLNPTPGQDYGTIGEHYVWWNGINTTKQKVDWVLQNGLGGVMIFAVGYDKLNDSRSLLQTINPKDRGIFISCEKK